MRPWNDPPPLEVLELMVAADAALSARGGAPVVPAPTRRTRPRQPLLADLDPQIDPRARRAIEDLQKVVNSLLIQGDILQTGFGRWMIPQGAFEAPRDPLATDDRSAGVRAGSLWVNVEQRTLWVCLDPRENQAEWRSLSSGGEAGGLTGTF